MTDSENRLPQPWEKDLFGVSEEFDQEIAVRFCDMAQNGKSSIESIKIGPQGKGEVDLPGGQCLTVIHTHPLDQDGNEYPNLSDQDKMIANEAGITICAISGNKAGIMVQCYPRKSHSQGLVIPGSPFLTRAILNEFSKIGQKLRERFHFLP